MFTRRAILTFIFSILLLWVVAIFLAIVKRVAAGELFYVLFLGTACIFFPLIFYIALFQWLRKKVVYKSTGKTLFLRIVWLLLLFLTGIALWVIGDSIPSGMTLANLEEDYTSQFSAFMPVGIILSIAVPGIDMLVDEYLKKKNSKRPAGGNDLP